MLLMSMASPRTYITRHCDSTVLLGKSFKGAFNDRLMDRGSAFLPHFIYLTSSLVFDSTPWFIWMVDSMAFILICGPRLTSVEPSFSLRPQNWTVMKNRNAWLKKIKLGSPNFRMWKSRPKWGSFKCPRQSYVPYCFVSVWLTTFNEAD